jgi:DNA topoisomerase IA
MSSRSATAPTQIALKSVQTDKAFNLGDLQAVALARFGMTPAQTTQAADDLYVRGLISYPRTQERLLELYNFVDSAQMARDYKHLSGDKAIDPEYRGPAWVADVSGEHVGISLKPISLAAVLGVEMSEPCQRIYGLVHERFMSLFKRP